MFNGKLRLAMPANDVIARFLGAALGGALLNPHPDGSVLVGSSREPAVTPEPADPEVPRHQVADAIELIPALADAAVRSAWWGVRPMSPDDRPMIGMVSDGLVVATGHGSEGVLLAGGTANLVTSIVLGQPAPFDASAFDPSRFDRERTAASSRSSGPTSPQGGEEPGDGPAR